MFSFMVKIETAIRTLFESWQNQHKSSETHYMEKTKQYDFVCVCVRACVSARVTGVMLLLILFKTFSIAQLDNALFWVFG